MDYISDEFIEIYGESFLNSYDAISDDFFKGFNSVVEKAIKIVPSKNGKFIDAFCKYYSISIQILL